MVQQSSEYISFEARTFKGVMIGPRDATDTSRNYLVSRADRIAEVVVGAIVENPAKRPEGIMMFAHQYSELRAEVEAAIADGTLLLSRDYPDLSDEQRVEQFLSDTIAARLPLAEESFGLFAEERAEQQRNPQPVISEDVTETERLQAKASSAELHIIAGHHLLVDVGVAPEIVVSYDRVTGIATAPEQDEKPEGVTTGKFWRIVGRKSLEMLHIRAA